MGQMEPKFKARIVKNQVNDSLRPGLEQPWTSHQ